MLRIINVNNLCTCVAMYCETHSLPVQNVLASLASHVTTPLSSSGRPSRFNGFESAAISSKRGLGSKYAAVMLQHMFNR